jgi:ribonuclease H2 subunit A
MDKELQPTNFETEEIILGIDEAGRGPVLGPMVYACCYFARSNESYLKQNFKFADSKQLTEKQREIIFKKMNYNLHILKYETRIIHAEELSNIMLDRDKTSLNVISHNAAIELIRRAISNNANIKGVYVDTVGPPEKYKKHLESFFSGIDIVVASKADDLYPVVSAASIAAKVTRDRIIHDWEFVEGNISRKLGCGYPSDPATKKWLQKNCDKVFGFPSIVRFSWKTTTNVLKDNDTAHIMWEDYIEDEKKKPAEIKEVKIAPKELYFDRNKLILNFTL